MNNNYLPFYPGNYKRRYISNYYPYSYIPKVQHMGDESLMPIDSVQNISKKNSEPKKTECFEIMGIKLYFDDILILGLLFFLYTEGVKDTTLYIALILLLLS